MSQQDAKVIFNKVKSGAFLEAKARGRYAINNWPMFAEMGISSGNAFIEDDLTIRRLEYHGDGLAKYLVVGTNDGRIVVYPAAVLNRLSLVRLANRPMKDSPLPKGKWLLSLKWGVEMTSMDDVVKLALASYRQGAEWAGVLESVSSPTNIVGIDNSQGIPRTHEHRALDLEDKR